MGFFTKKKEMKKELPPLKFPEFPKYESEINDDFSQIKDAVSTPMTSRQSYNIPDMIDMPREEPEIHRTEKTLFIKVDKYKLVMKSLDGIKDKLEELEKVINKLDELKKQEDDELAKWHSDLEYLKERLNNIDKTLFES